MRIGIVLPISEEDGEGGVPDYPIIREMAVGAEAAGLDSVWALTARTAGPHPSQMARCAYCRGSALVGTTRTYLPASCAPHVVAGQ